MRYEVRRVEAEQGEFLSTDFLGAFPYATFRVALFASAFVVALVSVPAFAYIACLAYASLCNASRRYNR